MATQSSFPGGSDGKKSACNDVNTILFLEVHTSSIISVKLLFFQSKYFYWLQALYLYPKYEERRNSKEQNSSGLCLSRKWNCPQFSSVTQSCLTLCDPMNRSTPCLPVHHQLPESIQTHVHWVSDAIQPSHSLSSPSPPAPNPSQHQGLFQWAFHIRWPKYWSFSFSISLLRVSIFHNLFVRSNLDCQLIFKIFVLFPTWILFLGRNLS